MNCRFHVLLALVPSLLLAEEVKHGVVYRYVDANGIIRSTNKKPPPDAQQEKLLFDYIETIGGQAWLETSSGEGLKVYVHPRSIKLKGRMATGWVLTDYEQPQATQWENSKSTNQRWTVDCEDQRYSATDELTYEGGFATGKVLHTWSGVTSLQSFPPGSIAEAVAAMLCAGPPPKT